MACYNGNVELTDWIERKIIPDMKGFISITGGGGKTSLMSLLGRFFAEKGRSVIMTTTTKVASPRLHDYGSSLAFGDESVLCHEPCGGELVFYAEHSVLDMKKWVAPREEVLSVLASRYDIVIAEADGSRGLPLKIHTERDPVIHPCTTAVIAVMGLWGIGDKIYSSVFGDGREGIIDSDYLSWYLNTAEGLSKGFCGNDAIIFNGADAFDGAINLHDLDYPGNCAACSASIRENKVYEVTYGY